MIIYSIEMCIADDVANQWVKWMLHKHIPDVMKTNLFVKFEFYQSIKLKNKIHYMIQYEMESIEKYLEYKNHFAKKLQKDHIDKFENKFSAKRNLFMQINNFD